MTGKPKLLTRDEILAAEDRKTQTVEVPEWGGAVTIRPLTGTERDHYERSLLTIKPNGKGGFDALPAEGIMQRARLSALSIIDAEGKRMFSDVDVLALGEKSGKALDRVYDAALELSGMRPEDVKKLAEGLKGERNGSTGSDSPES